MQKADENNYKYVFVCGLPRSGTSILGRNVARMENCTGFRDTGVIEDEGRFLQDVYPTEDECGGPGRFGFDPRAHLTETSPLLTPENALKLRRSWERYWDQSKTIHVEKTPANLLMTRFLQAAFPNSYFIVIRRHPVPVSIAIQKWKLNVTSLHNLFAHWLHCHELFEQDKKHLEHVYELRYEDYVDNPDKYYREIALFLGTRVPEAPKEDEFRTVAQWRKPGLRVPERAMEATSEAYNQRYFARWHQLLTTSPFRVYYRYIARKYEARFANYGYSLTKGFEEMICGQGKIPAAVGALCCVGADAGASIQRLLVRSKPRIRVMAKAVLPAFIADWVREARQRKSLDTEERKEEVEVRNGPTARTRIGVRKNIA